MSDTGTQTNDGHIVGAQSSSTPEQIRAQNQAIFAAQNPQSVQQPPAPAQQQQMFTAEQVEAFRQQEKDKLYPKLEGLEKQLSELTKEREERLQAEQAEKDRLAAEAAKAEEDKLSLRELIRVKDTEWQDKFSKLQQERETDAALLQKEREFGALNEYRARRVTEEQEHIVPQFVDYVVGGTPEEIEASIATAKVKSQELLQGFQQTQAATWQGMRGVSSTGLPSMSGPMENQTENRPLTPQQIAAMPMADYIKHRGQLLGAASQSFHNGQR